MENWAYQSGLVMYSEGKKEIHVSFEVAMGWMRLYILRVCVLVQFEIKWSSNHA